jgi:dTDP-4-dehydrorhamnose reductase
MKILVTGSNGLLGQKLIHLLRSREAVEVLATSSGENRISANKGYTYRSLDVTSEAEVNTVIEEFKPDAIIHTAALTLVDLCETEKEKCHALNVQSVVYLLVAAQRINAHFIHVSTDFVFNGENGPYSEEDEPDPLSEYARSKYKAEQILIKSEYKNWSIARTIILYGYTENMSRSNVVLWARETLRKGGPMNIVNDQFRAPTLAEDLAMGCWLIAEKKAKGIFHLSGPETMSVIEMVRRIARYYEFSEEGITEIDTSSLRQPAKRPPHTGFVLDKARKILDYNPHTLEEGLALIDEQLPL